MRNIKWNLRKVRRDLFLARSVAATNMTRRHFVAWKKWLREKNQCLKNKEKKRFEKKKQKMVFLALGLDFSLPEDIDIET